MGVRKPSFLNHRALSGLRARLLLLVLFAVVPSFGLILDVADIRRVIQRILGRGSGGGAPEESTAAVVHATSAGARR